MSIPMRLHVAIQPLPALLAFAGSRLASERALETIAVGLRTSNSHTLTISSSVLVSDADAKVVHSDLLEGVDAMVWVAMGMGWEAPTGALSTSDLVKSIRKLSQPPRILAIALHRRSSDRGCSLRVRCFLFANGGHLERRARGPAASVRPRPAHPSRYHHGAD